MIVTIRLDEQTVAHLDARYRRGPTWESAILESPGRLLAGPVLPGSNLTWLGWLYYYGEYSHFLPGRAVPEALFPVGNRAVREGKEGVQWVPGMAVELVAWPGLAAYLVERYQFSREIGTRRGWHHAFLVPALPLLLFVRGLRNTKLAWRWVALLPLLAISWAVQTAGELHGSVESIIRNSDS